MSMRISTSPVNHSSKIVQRAYQLPDNNRSNSLSNISLLSSKNQNNFQNYGISPYYNSNSAVRIISQEQPVFQSIQTKNSKGILQNFIEIENRFKKITSRIQTIQKCIKKQEKLASTQNRAEIQKNLTVEMKEKIFKEIQQRMNTNNEAINQQIRKMEYEIELLFSFSKKQKTNNVQLCKIEEESIMKSVQTQNYHLQKKNQKWLEEKIKQQMFKIQIHFENQINKSVNLIKASKEVGSVPVLTKSKLKYKYLPIQLSFKNQISVISNQSKNKKQTLSTTYSSGSSSENDEKQFKKVIEVEEQKYFIDKQGYLIDDNGFYLLNEEEKMIRIDRSLVKKLKENKMMD